MQDVDFFKFSDPQAEGPFSAAATRCIADAYIEGQIKGHESIIRYYNRCRNALTMTCRIPPEILSAIFGEVVRCTERQGTWPCNIMNTGHIDWIPPVSHVCSHWREVALAAPNLWSNIPLSNPPWAQEMVRRSYGAPLTIRYQGPMSITNNGRLTRPFETLTEILRFHLPRIKCLTIDSWSTFGGITFQNEGVPVTNLHTSILSLLNQPAPMIERLEIRVRNSEKDKLPYELFTISSRLRHLILEDCGMAWDSEHIDLRNLQSLQVLNYHQQIAPSFHQLLTLLRQMSCLESLHLVKRDPRTDLVDLSMLHDIDPVILGCLERIVLIGDLSYCVLLNHIVLLQNVCLIHLSIRDLHKISSPLAQALAGKFDNCIEGPILSLSLRTRSIRCWKSKDTTHAPSFHDPPTIHIGSLNTKLNEGKSFWQSLRLDQLISLEINNPLEQGSWTVFGNLPKVRDLRVWTSPNVFLNVLHHGLVGKLTADAQPVHMTFPALRNLTMLQCCLDSVANVEHNTSPIVSVAQLMLSCFELREKTGLPLESLKLEECTGADNFELEGLRAIIDQVDWIGIEEYNLEHDYDIHDEDFEYFEFGAWYEDEETDEDFEPYIHEDYDYDYDDVDYDYDDVDYEGSI